MNDSQFDDFVNDKLNEYAAPVPAGLWEKVAEGQFDQFIGGKLQNYIAPFPGGLWEQVVDGQFDQFVGNTLKDHTAAVPEGLFDKITDGRFDSFIADKLQPTEAAVPAGLWDKITDGQFDSFVAGKVQHHEAAVPAGLWEKVKPKEDEDDRVAYWWFRQPAAAVLLFVMVTAGAVGSYFFFSGKKGDAETAQVSTSNKPGETSKNNSAESNTVTVVPPATGEDKENETAQNNSNATQNAERQPLNANHSSENTVQLNGGLNGKDNNTANTSNARLSSNATIQTPNALSANPNEIFSSIQNAIAKNENRTGDGSSAGKDIDDLTIEPYKPDFSEAATVSPARFSLADLSNKQLFPGNRKFKSVIICPADKGINTDWFLETYISPDIAFKSVTNISATPTYMLKKDSAERSRIGYTAGIRLVKPITDNILLKAGLQYSQGNEQYVYRTENEVKTTTVVTVRTIIRAPGDTVIVQDTSILQTAGYKTNTVKNRYRSFDIPVTVGYQFGDEDLKFGINAGVVFNVSSWYQGMVLDSTFANVPLNKQGNGIYKSNIGLGLIGSISIVKRLGEDLHLFAEPYFRYNLSDMSTGQSGFRQRLSVGGLSLGLRFNLNRK